MTTSSRGRSQKPRSRPPAGRRRVKAIDYGSDYCDGEMTAQEWLTALVAHYSRAIAWTGGKCVLVNTLHPGIDTAAWPYCAQATISLVHPKQRDDEPMIEIYFEKPDQGHVGSAYAFRSLMMTRG